MNASSFFEFLFALFQLFKVLIQLILFNFCSSGVARLPAFAPSAFSCSNSACAALRLSSRAATSALLSAGAGVAVASPASESEDGAGVAGVATAFPWLLPIVLLALLPSSQLLPVS